MVSFIDGPAGGTHLMLRRAPLLLRVAQSAEGEFDALDQLDDEARAGEKLFVYLRAKFSGSCYITCRGRRGRGKRGRGGFTVIAEYKEFHSGPGQEILRDRVKWQEWANGAALRLIAPPAAGPGELFEKAEKFGMGR